MSFFYLEVPNLLVAQILDLQTVWVYSQALCCLVSCINSTSEYKLSDSLPWIPDPLLLLAMDAPQSLNL